MELLKNIFGLIFPVLLAAQSFAQTSESDFARLRKQMVSSQLAGRDITNPEVLNAMTKVPRHLFVPFNVRKFSYQDSALPIDYQQTISQPYIVALMTQLLSVKQGDKVLEVGTGSGYQAAILAEMGAEVFTIEIIPELGIQAEKLLHDFGYDKVSVKIGDGYKGWQEKSPFDAIIVTCAPARIPEPLQTQLKEGGKMVIPVGESSFQQLFLLTKKGGKIIQQKIIDVRFVPMVDEKGKSH